MSYQQPPTDPATLLTNLTALSAVDRLVFDRIAACEAGPLIGMAEAHLESLLRPHLTLEVIRQRVESLWKHGLIRCRPSLGLVFYAARVVP